MKLPIIALVGHPNVGKSTIFNKLVGQKISIIEDTPGVTRDRIYSEVIYKDYKYSIIDTGGIDDSKADFNTEIKIQASIAIDEADIVLFIVDGKNGISSNDYTIRDMLKKNNKDVIVVINKIDSKKAKEHIYDFYELGFENYIEVSGEQGIGFIELQELLISKFKNKKYEEKEDTRIKFSVVGRPNVGKSSLINALVNEERVIVSDVAGTTRDAIDSTLKYNGEEFVVIDTAGMRKKGKVYENIEKYSLLRSMKAIDRSDICLLVINAEEGIIEHDKHIAGYVLEKGKGLIIVVNKWDTVENKTIKEYLKEVRAEFQFLSYVPVVFTSALTKKRIHTIMPEVVKVSKNICRELKTSVLNDVINEAYMMNIPPSYKGRRLKIYFVNQAGIKPPTFVFHVNNKNLVHFSYERYLENKIRENFDFEGTPINIKFKNRNE